MASSATATATLKVLAHAPGHDRRIEHSRQSRPRIARRLGRRRQPRSADAGRCPKSLAARSTPSHRPGRGRPWPPSRSISTGALRAHVSMAHSSPTGRPPSRQQAAEGFVDQAGRRGRRVDAVGHLVSPRMIASWSGNSCSRPTLRPIMACWICPGQRQTGAFTAKASTSAAWC